MKSIDNLVEVTELEAAENLAASYLDRESHELNDDQQALVVLFKALGNAVVGREAAESKLEAVAEILAEEDE